MREARIIGNFVQELATKKRITKEELAKKLNCTEYDISKFFKGLAFPSFAQLCTLSDILNVSVEKLMDGDMDVYNRTVVHCMNDFENLDNRELILDILENYVDVLDSVNRN